MFGTIRKHQTWLWAIIITLTIISFVVFFSPYSKMHDVRSGNYGSIYGKKVTQEDYARAQREVYLRYFFMSGRWPDEDARRRGFDVMRETYQWMMLIRKQEDLGIEVGEDVAAQSARDWLRNFERQGVSSPSVFAQQVLQPQGMSFQDFERFVKHFVGMQELLALTGASGKLVTPEEAKSLYIRSYQPMSTEAVLFSASNYLAQVKVTPEAVAQFYTNSLANYRIPDRIQVAYVKFGVSNFMAQAESELSRSNLSEVIEAKLASMGTNYYGGAKTADEARARMKEDIIRARALEAARRKANDFARPLFETDKPSITALEQAARAEKLKLVVTAPFDRQNPPEEMEAGEDFAKVAFTRTADDPFGQPYRGMDGVYVYGLEKKLPSEIPTLNQIRARVENDYKLAQASSLARQAGLAFQSSATNGLAQGKSFDDLCKAANVKPHALPEFSISTRSINDDIEQRVSLNLLKELAFSTEPGKVSAFQATQDGGVVLFVKARLPINQARMDQDMPQFLAELRRSRTDEAFQSWFRKEAEKALRDTPLAQEAATARSGRKS